MLLAQDYNADMQCDEATKTCTMTSDVAVAVVRSRAKLLNECAKEAGIADRADEKNAISVGPAMLTLYLKVMKAANAVLPSIYKEEFGKIFGDIAAYDESDITADLAMEFAAGASEGVSVNKLLAVAFSAITSAPKTSSQPGWFAQNWKWILGTVLGVAAVVTVSYVVYKRRNKTAA